MGSFVNYPDADDGNFGWVVVSTKTAHMYAILSDSDDSEFISCPGSKGKAQVTFPIDLTTVPSGAVVTSVDVQLRTSLGSGTAPQDHSPSVTVFLSCTDHRDYSVQKTMYPTSTSPTTLDVGSYKKDPVGLAWDVERLNRLMVGVFSYEETYDLIRVYELFVTVNYHEAPTLSPTAPNGVLQTSAPELSWSYSQANGDPQVSMSYRIFTSAQQAVVNFSPTHAVPVFSGSLSGSAASLNLPTSLAPGGYWVFMSATSSFGASSPWVGKAFTLQGPTPGVPGVPAADQPPGTSIVDAIIDSGDASATITLADTSNMMSVQDADAETLTDGSSLICTNCGDGNGNPVRDSAVFFPGGLGSWQMIALANGDMTYLSDWIEVAPDQPITATGQVIASGAVRVSSVQLQYYDYQFQPINSGTWPSYAVTDSTSTWTELSVSDETPSNVVYVRGLWTVSAALMNEQHNIDRLGIMYGTDTPWSDGGHMSNNLLSSWYSTLQGFPQGAEGWSPASGTLATTTGTSGTGLGSSGTICGQMVYVGVTPTIGYRGQSTVFSSPTAGSDYTLNAPAGLQQGDLMIAYVRTTGGVTDINPPFGWTLVDEQVQSQITMFVLMRSAGASEPTNWTDGSLVGQANQRSAVVVAYSGAADASEQFIDEGTISTVSATPTYVTTPQLNNTDPNAWRVSAFAFLDDANVSSIPASMSANQLQPATIPAPQYVGTSWLWAETGWNDTNFYIFRPPNMQVGDFMIATFALSGNATVTPPSGWTIIDTVKSVQQGGATTMVVMTKFAVANEPSQWGPGHYTGSYSSSPTRDIYAVAYRNVNPTTPLIAHSAKAAGPGTKLSTNSVTNTNSLGVVVASFAVQTDGEDSGFTTAGALNKRGDGVHNDSNDSNGVDLAVYDLGPLSTGSYSYSATFSDDFFSGAAWIGILNPLSSAPSSVANETQRSTSQIGTTGSYLYASSYDSNAVVPTGNQSVTGRFFPGDGDGKYIAAAGWAGIVAPADQVVSGMAQVQMATEIDISQIDPTVLTLAGPEVSASGIFTGTSGGTPYLTLTFLRANQVLDSVMLGGSSFVPGIWTKSSTVAQMPAGTTRISMTLSVPDRSVGDLVYYDRLLVGLGTSTAFRPGTARSAHPVWATPQLEYAEDQGQGYTAWAPIPGSQKMLPPSYDDYSGLAVYTDHSLVPLRTRKYRARTISYGLGGDQFVSPYGPDSNEFRFIAQYWWLKDFSDSSNNIALFVKWDNVDVGTTNTGVVYQPIGDDLPVIVTEGFKGDSLTITATKVDHDTWVRLMVLLRSGKTLYLQSDVDQSWWVQPTGDITSTLLPTGNRKTNPIREVKMTFIQVTSPE